jgi:hypothetical protein
MTTITSIKELPLLIATTFRVDGNREVARIGPDGIMRFSVEANDENAARFVECIEMYIGRRLAGVTVDVQTSTNKEVEPQ